jgi:hypothetical protein
MELGAELSEVQIVDSENENVPIIALYRYRVIGSVITLLMTLKVEMASLLG